MNQALYNAFRDLLEAPWDLSALDVGHTVMMSERFGLSQLLFSRRRIEGKTSNGLLILNENPWSEREELYFLPNGRCLSDGLAEKRRLHMPLSQFKALFAWQEAIREAEFEKGVLMMHLGLRAREQFYHLLQDLPAPDPDSHMPLPLRAKMPEKSKEAQQTFWRYAAGLQALDRVRKGQKVIWISMPPLSTHVMIVSTKVVRSTKRHLFLLSDEQVRHRLNLGQGQEIRFDRQGQRKGSPDQLYLPHRGFEYFIYSEALYNAIDELFRVRIHLASYEQVLALLTFLCSFPQSNRYYLPDLQGR